MHKGVILLVKASSKEEASGKASEFMEGYQGQVWDWWQVGGRWTGTLDNYNPSKDPKNLKTCWLCQGTGLRNDELGKQARKENPEYTCNGCGGTGKSVEYPSNWSHDNNIMPLSECIGVVREWEQDPQAEYDKRSREAFEHYKDNRSMRAYCLKVGAQLLGEDFCFDCNVYNLESYDYSIPEDVTGFFAVIVDMHN
jgi:hypothetical protein